MVDTVKKRLISLFVYNIYKKKLLSHSDIRKMRYGMEVIINELFKLGVLIIVFKFLGKLDLFLFSLTTLIPIRCFSGGMHFHSNLNCLLFTLAFFLIACNSIYFLPSNTSSIYYIMAIASIAIIGLLSPNPSDYRPIKCKRKRQAFRILAFFFSIGWLLILFLFYPCNEYFFKCGIMTIFLQALQLILGCLANKNLKFSKEAL